MDKILTCMSYKLHVVDLRKIFCECTFPGSRFLVSLKEKYLSVVAGSIKKKRERKNATFDFNDQIPEGGRRNNTTLNPLWTTDPLQFNSVVKLG